MVSLEGLTKVVDPSQLTADFDGSLDYNHEEWIEVRLALSLKTVCLIGKSLKLSKAVRCSSAFNKQKPNRATNQMDELYNKSTVAVCSYKYFS